MPVLRRERPIYRVFVSSTWTDLQPERQALMDALHHMDEMRFVGMEYFGNRPETTHAASLDQVALSDVLILVVGARYGSGITEAEYRQARSLGLPCFVYFKTAALAAGTGGDEHAADREKLARFKQDLLANHTVKELDSPAALAVRAAGDLHNWVASRWISLAPAAPAAPERTVTAASDRTSILRLIERVRADWIEGVLGGSLHRRAWMELGIDWRDGAVEHPWDRIVIAANRPVQALARKETIADIFRSAQNTLLVLGEPGAGKTTTLLELARDLLQRARDSAAEPAPVVLALSTWSGRHRTLADWLIEELNVRYQVPKRLAKAWLEEARLVLLLDGLDEVHESQRAQCVTAINTFAQQKAPPGLAISCRVAEYSGLRERLQLRAAICLQPLSPTQIDAYFAQAGAGLEHLRGAIRGDAALRELAQTPLMLSVMAMAWRDAPPESLRPRDAVETVDERRTQLLEAYVATAQRRKAAPAAEVARMMDVLRWLARQMRARGQTLFAVEQLQPDWLDGTARQFLYFLLTRTLALLTLAAIVLPVIFQEATVKPATLLVLAVTALGSGLAVALLDFALFRPNKRWKTTPRDRAIALGVLLLIAMFASPLLGRLPVHDSSGVIVFYFVLCAAALTTAVDVERRDIQPADAIGFSWRQGGNRALTAMVGWQLFLILGMLQITAFKGWSKTAAEFGIGGLQFWIGLAVGTAVATPLAWRHRAHGWGLVIAVAACAAFCAKLGADLHKPWRGLPMVFAMLLIGLVVALFGGLTSAIDEKRARRTGVWFWLKVPLLASIGVGLAIGLVIAGNMIALDAPLAMAAVVSGVIGAFFALTAFFRFGGFQGVQHFVLRGLLAQSGRLPLRAGSLLDHAARVGLTQKVGLGHRFIHALVLDHLAGPPAAQTPRAI